MNDIYVVVTERSLSPRWVEAGYEDHGPLVFETSIHESSVDDAKKRIARLNGDYGKCRIAKLVFVDEVPK